MADELNWSAIKIFNGCATDGSVVITSKVPGRTAVDVWPVDGELPEKDALTEIVLYRTRFQDMGQGNFERMNFTALAGKDEAAQYRFGVERGGTGEFRAVYVAFEDVTPGVAYIPFKIEPPGPTQGVYARNRKGNWKRIGW